MYRDFFVKQNINLFNISILELPIYYIIWHTIFKSYFLFYHFNTKEFSLCICQSFYFKKILKKRLNKQLKWRLTLVFVITFGRFFRKRRTEVIIAQWLDWLNEKPMHPPLGMHMGIYTISVFLEVPKQKICLVTIAISPFYNVFTFFVV